MQHRARRKSAAFTLLELLVLIGVISVLVAILVPALGAARSQANETQCLSNLRAVGQSFQAYAAGTRGLLPPPLYDLVSPSHPNSVSTKTAVFDSFPSMPRDAPANWVDALIDHGGLVKQVVDCPESDGLGQVGASRDVPSDNAIEFAINGLIAEPIAGRLIGLPSERGQTGPASTLSSSRFAPYPLSAVTRASEGMLVMDSLAGSNAASGSRPYVLPDETANPANTALRLRHRGGTAVNVLFFDGRAESRIVGYRSKSPDTVVFDQAPYSDGELYLGTVAELQSRQPTPFWRPWRPFFK